MTSLIGVGAWAQTNTDSVMVEPKCKIFSHQFEAGWMNYTDIENSLIADLSASYVISYIVNPRLEVGIGSGYERYMNFNAVPLFLQVKGVLVDRKSSPYAYFRGGKSYMVERFGNYSDVDGGDNYSAGLGYQWKFEHASLSLSLGYKTQLLKTINDQFYYYLSDASSSFFAPYPDSITKINWKMQRVEFRVGVSF